LGLTGSWQKFQQRLRTFFLEAEVGIREKIER